MEYVILRLSGYIPPARRFFGRLSGFGEGLAGICELLFTALIAFVIANIFGSMSIPLVYKFGAERGRVLLLVSFLLPAGICFGVCQLLVLLGVKLTNQHVFILLCRSSVIAFLWSYGMYRISCRIFPYRNYKEDICHGNTARFDILY